MPPPSACTICGSGKLRTFLPLGDQPPSNRFIAPDQATKTEERFSISLGRCESCQTIQLVDRMPVEAIRPRYDWLSYNEPEGHLDDVAAKLASLPGMTKGSRILGVTYKDRSTLDRLARAGFSGTVSMSEEDLGAPVSPFGLETIQAILSDEGNVARLSEKYGRADMVIFRHIVEHASNAARLLRSLRALLAPGGYLVFEVPDPRRMLAAGNHAFIWEEHVSYLTPASLKRLAGEVGARLQWLGCYEYPYEDSLVAALSFEGGAAENRAGAAESGNLQRFADEFEPSRQSWRRRIEAHRAAGRKVAMFGAGHLSAKFVNFLGLADLLECVIDDHQKKVGMLMPGSRLPIVASSELSARNISICISTLSPESEVKVREKLAPFFSGGGIFEPAFAVV
jgi:SAM-dependent methyltransferase